MFSVITGVIITAAVVVVVAVVVIIFIVIVIIIVIVIFADFFKNFLFFNPPFTVVFTIVSQIFVTCFLVNSVITN